MENISVSNNLYSNKDNINETDYYEKKLSLTKLGFGTINSGLTAESGKKIFDYLKRFNLLKEPDLMILFPNHHYFYDKNDFKSVRTLIFLKKLNLIKDTEGFLYTISQILEPNVNFIVCFSERKSFNGIRFLSNFSKRFVNLLDSRIDREMDKTQVSTLLGKHGFRVIDMTEMDGLTYSYSKYSCQNFKTGA